MTGVQTCALPIFPSFFKLISLHYIAFHVIQCFYLAFLDSFIISQLFSFLGNHFQSVVLFYRISRIAYYCVVLPNDYFLRFVHCNLRFLQALVDDLLDHRLNRVTVDLPGKDGMMRFSNYPFLFIHGGELVIKLITSFSIIIFYSF